MNAHSTVFLFWLLFGAGFGAGCAPTAELSGIYVNKEYPRDRIEFLADGKYFRGYCGGSQGTYTREKDTYVCKGEDGGGTRFRLKGRILVDQGGDEWIPRDDIVKMPWKDVSPVTMVVLDRKTREPLAKFSYTYQISTPKAKYDPMWVRPIEVESDDGTFVLSAPKSCKIEMRIEGETVLGGFGTWREYHLTADNKKRRIEVLVETGIDVKGVVVDARTRNAIKGALVSPVIFTSPGFAPDRDRAVKTDAKGKFTIRGVDYDIGIRVWHSNYFELNCDGFKKVGKNLYTARIELKAGENLFGVVKDPSGKPLAGVGVSDGAGKHVRTGKDGSFVLRSPRKWSRDGTYDLSFKKDGYLDKDLCPKSADPKGFSVVLVPQPVLTGQVFAPDGQPVTTYNVSAGVGLEPRPWRCSFRKVLDSEGRFSLRVRTDWDYGNEGKVWIGVKAPGFAPWATTIDTWQGTESITARLKPGVAVHGSIKNPKGPTGNIYAKLLPCRIHKEEGTRKTSQRQELGRMETAIDRSGAFRFNHVGPGTYLLAISGPAISPIGTGIAVSNSDLDVGSFRASGRGSVRGVVYQARRICDGEKCHLDEKRSVWAFADGSISFTDTSGRSNDEEFKHLKPIPFKTDENGRFRVDGVPVGMVSVDFDYNATSDIIGTHSRTAKVLEGKTTEVRFFNTSGDWEVACKFVIGDGSPAQFSSGTGMGAKRKVGNVTTRHPVFIVKLEPKENVPVSFCDSYGKHLIEKNYILLLDVHPGKYRLVVGDWMGSRGFHEVLYERNVDIKPDGTTLTIPLEAGCITGAVQWSKDYRYMIHVIAAGKKTHTIRHARCDDKGNFCTRYLPEDDYTLFAHDYNAGWCKMPGVFVKNNITDIESHELVPGGTITGKVPPRFGTDITVTVVATDPRGIPIKHPNHREPIGKGFTISGLWPGKWVVTLKKGEEAIAEKIVTLQGTETVSCNLVEE